MAELKFLKGAYSAYTAKTSYDENSFYVTMEPVGEKTMYALWLGKELIASGNTVAALQAEIVRAEAAELALSDRIAKFEGEGEGSVKDQIAKLEEALEQQIADEETARKEAVSALTQDIVDVNADLDTEEAARIAADEVLSGAIDDNAAAIEKLNGDAETVGSVAKAVADAKSELLGDAAADYNTLGKLEDKIQAVEAAAKSYSIAVASVADENVKEAYKLVDEDGVQVGETIKIYKDSALQSVVLSGQQLVFTYILASGQTEVVGVDVSNFLAESEFANGLQVVDHVVSVKVAEGSEAFLTVDANGVKLSGVQDAIDDAVKAEKERAEGVEADLDAAIKAEAKTRGEEITRVEGLISAEETRAKAEEGKLAQAIADEAARAEGEEGELAKAIEDEATARENADKALSDRIAKFEGTGEGSVAAQIESAKTELNNAITAEATARENADTQLNTAITTEKNRAEGKEAELAQAIATEKTARETAVKTEKERAEGVEAGLDAAIKAEAKRADEAEKANAKAIADEKTRAEGAETELNNAITAETSAREAADKAINDKIGTVAEGKTVVEMINDAKAAATAAHTKVAKDDEAAHITLTSTTDEAGAVTYTIGESDIASKSVMDQKIADIESDINFLISGGTLEGTLESIKEIDEYLKAHEGEASNMMTAIQANAAAISAETSAREAAVKGEKERAEAAEAFLSGAIDTEVAERKAAVSAETDARVAADNVLSGKIDTEITNREAADNVLSGAIDTEVTERKAAVSAVAADLAAEVSRATSAETALDARLDTLENGENSVAAQIESAKTELNNAITAETSARETADNALSDRLDAIEAVTVTGKDAIVVSASDATENKEVSLKLAENQVDAAGAGVKLTQDGNGLKATMEWGTF